jgi:hypothetical protein
MVEEPQVSLSSKELSSDIYSLADSISTVAVADDLESLASDFIQVRADTVLTFHKWSHPMFETGLTREHMAVAMIDISEDFTRFEWLASEETGLCFLERCKRISASLSEMGEMVRLMDNLPPRARVSALTIFNVLGDQIGRLTLHGYVEKDGYSAIMRQKSKSETYRWHQRFCDPECEQIQKTLVQYWKYLHFYLAGCTCFHCKWEYQLLTELGLSSIATSASSLQVVPVRPNEPLGAFDPST